MAYHIATIAAYPLKDELGGGYRGVMLIRATKTAKAIRHASERLDSLAAATRWAKQTAHDAYSPVGYCLAAVRRQGEYKANVWVS